MSLWYTNSFTWQFTCTIKSQIRSMKEEASKEISAELVISDWIRALCRSNSVLMFSWKFTPQIPSKSRAERFAVFGAGVACDSCVSPFPWTMQKLIALPIHQAYFEVDYCVLYLYNRSLRSNLNSKGLNEKLASLSCLPVLCDWFSELWLAKLSLLWLVEVFFRANYWSKNRFII